MKTSPTGMVILALALFYILYSAAASAPTPATYKPKPAFAREGFGNPSTHLPSVEGFQGLNPASLNDSDAPRAGPADVKKVGGEPYVLLEDVLRPTEQDVFHKGETAISCYAKDGWRPRETVGNYRQETNNYRMDYPDSCMTGFQEGVLSFYKNAGKYA